MADRKAFSFYRSYFEAACALPTKEEQADFLLAICDYALNGIEPSTIGATTAMFKLVKPNIDSSISKAEAGAIGGKNSRSKVEADENNHKALPSRSEANESKVEADESNHKAINDNRNMINENKDINIPPIGPPKLKNWELQFEEFWKEYPRKVGKGAAKRAFEKVIKSMTLETLVTAVRRQKCGSQWTKDNGQFIPHPATWLNQARWEDEVDGGVVNDGNRNAATSRNWNLHTDI